MKLVGVGGWTVAVSGKETDESLEGTPWSVALGCFLPKGGQENVLQNWSGCHSDWLHTHASTQTGLHAKLTKYPFTSVKNRPHPQLLKPNNFAWRRSLSYRVDFMDEGFSRRR
jgi:hypothetical protein